MVELCGWLDSFSFHMFRRASEGVVSSGAVQVRKLLCDFSRLGAGTWPCKASHKGKRYILEHSADDMVQF